MSSDSNNKNKDKDPELGDYEFKTELEKELQVPQGIIDSVLGTCFTPEEIPKELSQLRKNAVKQTYIAANRMLNAFQDIHESLQLQVDAAFKIQKDQEHPPLSLSTLEGFYDTAFFASLHSYIDVGRKNKKMFIGEQLIMNKLMGTIMTKNEKDDPETLKKLQEKAKHVQDVINDKNDKDYIK